MAAAASSSSSSSSGAPILPADKVEQDPHATLDLTDDDDIDFSATSAADLITTGLSGLVMALNLCPEATNSGKRTKQIHRKGDLHCEGADLKLKWNVDYKAGRAINVRIVTTKDKEAPGSDGEAPSSSGGAGAGAAEGDTPAPVAGRKRARKEPPKPEDVDVRAVLQQAVDACVAQGKATAAESLQAVLSGL